MQKRIEIITTENNDRNAQTKLRRAMTDLVKENEKYKRECNNKDKEIQRLIDAIYKLKWKLNRAERRLDKLNNRETIPHAENDEDDPFLNPKGSNIKNGVSFFLKGHYVPKNIEFRLEYLQEEYYSNEAGFYINLSIFPL